MAITLIMIDPSFRTRAKGIPVRIIVHHEPELRRWNPRLELDSTWIV